MTVTAIVHIMEDMNGNQWKPDPRQSLFKEYYTNPNSETFSNAYQSAIKAGYDESYAKTITRTENAWVAEIIRDLEMVKNAEKALNEMVAMDTMEPVITMIGTIKDADGNIVKKQNTNLMKIKQDTAKFIAERLNKNKYSQKSEIDAKISGDLNINVVTYEPKPDDTT